MNAPFLHAEIVRDEQGLAELAPQWWALWQHAPSATPFQSPAWLAAWWRHFAPGELATIAVWRGSRLAGLAPFYIEHGERGGRLLPVGISLSDYLDVLVEPVGHEPVEDAMMEAARSLSWQTWELEEAAPHSRAVRLRCPEWLILRSAEQSPCPVIELHGATGLAACVPAKRRRQLRRALAFAARRGPTAIVPADARPGYFLDQLFRLHAACWEARGQPGVLADPKVRSFLEEALPALSHRQIARCYLLEIGGVTSGAYLGFLDRGRAYAYLGGFDPAFADESPGSILIGHAIGEAIREGAAEFHFLRGAEAYKYSWGAADRWNRKQTFARSKP
jgi:CelD/BcsL family acetyltransferase involved in cellulose biosynthesis